MNIKFTMLNVALTTTATTTTICFCTLVVYCLFITGGNLGHWTKQQKLICNNSIILGDLFVSKK